MRGFVRGVLSGNGLCLEGVMYGGGFVQGGLSEGVLSGGGFVRAPARPAIIWGGVELLFSLHLSSVSLSFVNTSAFEYHTIISPTLVPELGCSFCSFFLP